MYKATAVSVHYAGRAGNASIRPFANGRAEPLGDKPLELRPSFIEQYRELKTRGRALEGQLFEQQQILAQKVPLPPGLTYGRVREQAEEIRSRLANVIREKGDMGRICREASRLAFETIFVAVAQRRLPKDTFLLIVEDAREVWRQEGWPEAMPQPTNKERVRNLKRSTRNPEWMK